MADAVFKKITLNDQVIQGNVEVADLGDVRQGPLRVSRGTTVPWRLRNIKITLPAHP